MTKIKFVWEKWIDPLNSNIDEVEYPGHDFPSADVDRPIEFLSSDANFEEKYEEYVDDADSAEASARATYNPIRIVQTPHGFISLTEHSFASKHFDFWTLHCTEDITDAIIDAVEKCPGVETINALTRYRIRLGFNRPLLQSGAFNLNKIRKRIEETIASIKEKNSNETDPKLLFFTQDVQNNLTEMKQSLSGAWVIYIFPNGSMEAFSEPEKSDVFSEKLKFFNEIRQMIGGETITSFEE